MSDVENLLNNIIWVCKTLGSDDRGFVPGLTKEFLERECKALLSEFHTLNNIASELQSLCDKQAVMLREQDTRISESIREYNSIMAKWAIESDESLTECVERNIDGWKKRALMVDSWKKRALMAEERIAELEAELQRVAPFLAAHNFGGYSFGPIQTIVAREKTK